MAGRDTSELLEAVMAARLAKTLGLNDEQTVLMVRRFAEYKEETTRLKRRRNELLKELKGVVHSQAAEGDIDTALKGLVEHDAKLAKFKFDAFQKASEDLSVTQRAKLYVFLNDFETDMRRLIQRAREHRGRWGRQFWDEETPEYQGEEGAGPRFRRGPHGGPGPRRGGPPTRGGADEEPQPPRGEGSGTPE